MLAPHVLKAQPLLPRGERYGDGRPAPLCAAHGNLPPMQFYKLGYDGEPEATTPAATFTRRVAPIVRFENAKEVFARYTGSGVPHRKLNVIWVYRLDRDEDSDTARGVGNGVFGGIDY